MLARYVARFRGKLGVIDDIVGLAPSSHGTTNPLAPPLGVICPACAEQAAGSAFMKKLNAGVEAPPPPSYTVISTKHDEVVTPYRSQALKGATNVVLQDRCPEDITEHVGIIYDPIALQWVLERARAHRPGRPGVPPAVQRQRRATRRRSRSRARAGRRSTATSAAVRVVCTGVVGPLRRPRPPARPARPARPRGDRASRSTGRGRSSSR